MILTLTTWLAFGRGNTRALGPLRQALRVSRDSGSGERMRHAVELAAYFLHQRGRAREGATLVGAIDAACMRLPRMREQWRSLPLGWAAGFAQLASGSGFEELASVVSVGFDEQRLAGRSLSLERAADLALRILDEEMALAPTPAGGCSEAAGQEPSISSHGGRS
jgi:hypothetical protein